MFGGAQAHRSGTVVLRILASVVGSVHVFPAPPLVFLAAMARARAARLKCNPPAVCSHVPAMAEAMFVEGYVRGTWWWVSGLGSGLGLGLALGICARDLVVGVRVRVGVSVRDMCAGPGGGCQC